MRYTEITLTPVAGGFGPTDRQVCDDPTIRRQTLDQIQLLNDRTAVLLCEVDGERSNVERTLETSPTTLAYQISETAGGFLIYLHYLPGDLTIEVLSLVEEHEIIVDTPAEFTADGGLRLTVFGEEHAVQETIAALPGTVRMGIERTGEYVPHSETPFSMLTDNQQETLQVAMEMGYYEVPRQTTHAAIARERDRTAGTIGEQLQRIERTVFDEIVPWE